jgi:DNA-binding NtrC family response regulator
MSGRARVLIVDDEEDMRLGLCDLVCGEGYEAEQAGSGRAALERVRAEDFDLVLVDLKMPGVDGLGVLEEMGRIAPEVPVVIITGYATVESAVAAMRGGAYDYLAKPFKLDQVRLVVGRAIEQKHLRDENRRLRHEVESYHRFEQLLGRSAPMQAVFAAIDKAAPTPSTVLVRGETGTGKELVARALHQRSARAAGAFVAISCGALNESLLESELFGHVKGAFTGAMTDRVGVFEAADGGTLFLDEIGDVPPAVQVRLLRVLQEREVQRLGETRCRKVDVRLVAATHKDLETERDAGRFREDLYYRLNVMQLEVPPLRQRREDIPLLVEHFLEKYGRQIGKAVAGFSPAALALLADHHWPGNVRELENAVERAVILHESGLIEPGHLPLQHKLEQQLPHEGLSLREVERRHILQVLEASDYNQSKAAQLLGIGRRTLYRKVHEYQIALRGES